MFRKFIACGLTAFMFGAVLFAHGDATHVMGTVTSIDGDHVTVKLQDGKTQMVMVDKATKYFNAAEKSAKRADMKVGSRVVIDAKMNEKMKMLLASEVRIGVTEPSGAKK